MKRISLSLLTLFAILSNLVATNVTIADFSNLPTTYGSISGNTFTTNAASGMAGVKLTTSGVTLGSSYVNASYGNCLSFTTSDTNAHTITLTAPTGHTIKGYSIGASANTSSNKHVLTAADGTSVTFNSLGYNNGQFQFLNVSGLDASSTSFTIQTQNGGNTLYAAYITVYLDANQEYALNIVSGKYYRLHSYYTTMNMSQLGSGVCSVNADNDSYSQLWQITASGDYYTFKNVLTGNYIQPNTQQSGQWTMGSTACNFTSSMKTVSGDIWFSFKNSSNSYGLHTSASQNNMVVAWNYTAEASYWRLEEVELTSAQLAEIAEIQSLTATNHTTALANFFTDNACTTLKNNYVSMTDAQLRSAMSSLPTALQDMAVSVKNNTWDSSKDATWNTYAKDFRIHSYEIFSNSYQWASKTGTGPFAHLFHPTGIRANAGDIVCLFVDNDVADSDASLQVECVAGVDCSGDAFTIQKGYNAIYVPYECELFISYLLNNTSKSCNDYPDIKVHIEGGTCNGCFDMRGHGHTNSDWEWLKTNMFTNTYLHVKGNSNMLNTYRERVVNPSGTQNVEGIMNIFDFIFDKLQSLAGCDQWKTTGQYKMMANNYDVSEGNPHWANNYGYAQPGIYYDGIFNYNNLTNVGKDGGHIWVIEHELGHGHQGPINLSGQTESSNNSLVQCVNFLTTTDPVGQQLFATTRSSRGDGVKAMISRFNNGYSWIDYGGMRTQTGTYDDVWISNKLIFQLWLYFDYMGNYQPDGGNTGFSFMTALYDKLRANGLRKSTDSSNPANATQDYLLIAKYAAEITQTDLSEYFDAWGFWETEPTVSNSNDIPDSHIYYFPDYNNTYVKVTESMVNSVRSAMQLYTKKASNIMFLEDRCTGSTLPTYNNASVSSFGETGYYATYGESVTGTYKYTTSGTKVTISGDGAGAVGFKIYDNNGNLVAISNTKTFNVKSDVVTGLANGTYRMVAAQGDGNDVAVPSTGAKSITYILKYEGTEVERVENVMVIPNSSTEANMPNELKELGNFGDWMDFTYSPTTTTSSTTTVNVTATWNGPFSISTNYDGASWYKLRQRADEWGIVGYATYDSEKDPNIIMPSTNADTDATKWAFIGNPYTGLTIVNKVAGSGLKLVSESPENDDNTGGNTYATMSVSGTFSNWFVTPSPYHKDGFFISNSDGYAFNWRSYNNMAYWTGGKDRGSTFTIWDTSDFLPGITDLTNLSNNKAYLITNARRTWKTAVNEVEEAMEYSLGTTVMFEPTMLESQYAIIKYNDSYYLYSITAQQFLTNTGKFSETPQKISISPTNNDNYPWLFSFDDTHIVNINSEGNVVVNDWNTIDEGNSNAIIEAVDFDPSYAMALLSNTVEVTYNLVYNGETIKTGVIVKEIGSTPNISDMSGWDNGLMSYSYDVESITASSKVVNITATWNGPFKLSTDYANAIWYILKLKDETYPTYVGNVTPNVTLPTTGSVDDTQRWAFIGNPYTGLTIINKAAGSNLKLVYDEPTGDGGSTYATLQSSGANELWIPKVSSHLTNGFYLYTTSGNYALNQRSNANLAFWSGADKGSTFTVEEIPDNWAEHVIKDCGPFFSTDIYDTYFTIPLSVKNEWQTRYEDYSVNATEAQYKAIKEAIEGSVIYPSAGKYRIKSSGSRDNGTPTYIYCENDVLKTSIDPDASVSTFIFTGEYPNFKISVAGKNVQIFPPAYSQPVEVSEDEGNTIVFSSLEPGYCVIDNYYHQLFFHEDANHNVVGWYSDAAASKWMLERVSVIGDVNDDGQVSIADVTALVNIILGKDNTQPYQYNHDAADVNGDESISIADVTALVNIILGKQ